MRQLFSYTGVQHLAVQKTIAIGDMCKVSAEGLYVVSYCIRMILLYFLSNTRVLRVFVMMKSVSVK